MAGVSALALTSPELECISLHGIVGLADEAVRALCDACPKLRHVNVSMTRVTERGLRLLAVKDSLRFVCLVEVVVVVGVYVFCVAAAVVACGPASCVSSHVVPAAEKNERKRLRRRRYMTQGDILFRQM